jgi:hypothetical protein
MVTDQRTVGAAHHEPRFLALFTHVLAGVNGRFPPARARPVTAPGEPFGASSNGGCRWGICPVGCWINALGFATSA